MLTIVLTHKIMTTDTSTKTRHPLLKKEHSSNALAVKQIFTKVRNQTDSYLDREAKGCFIEGFGCFSAKYLQRTYVIVLLTETAIIRQAYVQNTFRLLDDNRCYIRCFF
jgi:hypothetical protein